MNVLSLYDESGNMILPWAKAGHFCVYVDIRHPRGTHIVESLPNVRRVGADIRSWFFRDGWDFFDIVFAAPPCTHLASSGARWWARKGAGACFEGVHSVYRARDICYASHARWMIESPVGRLSTIWRKPNYTFNPCDYGDPYTKKTCLWTGGGFLMPEKKPVEPVEGSRMHMISPSKDRARLRAVTPLGFARAVYEANKDLKP